MALTGSTFQTAVTAEFFDPNLKKWQGEFKQYGMPAPRAGAVRIRTAAKIDQRNRLLPESMGKLFSLMRDMPSDDGELKKWPGVTGLRLRALALHVRAK
jgi:hypothetical protein